LAAVVVIAVGGFFGYEFYTQHRITSEVEAAFAQIRAGGGKASHGKVTFDLRSRTIRITDIAAESATQPPVSIKIAGVTAQVSTSLIRRVFRLTTSKGPAWRSASASLVRLAGASPTRRRKSS
jgi:hypothetical protein